MPEARTPPLGLAAACVGLLVALHVVSRSARDALFLSNYTADDLPKVMLGAAIVGLPTVLASARLIARFGPGRVVVVLLLVSGLLNVFEWMLLARRPHVAVIVLYVHASIASGIAVSGFWSAVTERFDPHTVRKVAGRLSAGAAAGGLLGGLFARYLGGSLGPQALLPMLAGSSAVAALAVRGFSGQSRAFRAASATGEAVRSVTASRYLMTLATLVLLTGLSSVLVDFSFKAGVSRAPWSGHDLVSFFALFYAATSVASVLLQLTLARWVLGNLGLRAALTALPGAVASLGLLGIALPATWVLVALRGSSQALETSLFRAAYEPLYAPLPTVQKRSAKPLIDVAADRAGEAIGSGFALVIASALPLLAPRLVLAAAVVAALVCVWLSTRLERGYVAALASSLRSGKVHLDAEEVEDATTRLTLSQTQLEIDRETLLAQIQEMRRRAASPDTAPGGASEPPDTTPSPLDARLRELRSGNPERVRAALSAAPLEPELVSLVIPLLAEDRYAEDATSALRRVATKSAGQLLDALLDHDRPARLRRRIPRVLRASVTPRVVRGLAEALTDPEFEIRYRSGLALRDLVHQDRELRPPQSLVFAAARHEVDASHAAWKARSASLDADHQGEASGRVALPDRALDHVFTLLGLALDAEPVELARRALSTSDVRLRGTALEYLEQVVPEPIRTGIWPYLQAGRAAGQARQRSASEIVEELSRSFG
jgi:ATP:ADP antiporter, AAA family